MKYAIVESGGKQYKAVEGNTIEVDRLDLAVGKKIDFKDILLVADGDDVSVGTPKVSGAKVSATIVDQFKGPKIIIYKYHPRKRYRLKRGHRQNYTRILIESITTKTSAKKAETQAEKPKTKTASAKKAAPKKPAVKKAAAAKKPAAKKPAVKKPAPKKAAAKKPASKTKSTPKKAAAAKKPKPKTKGSKS